MAEPSPSISLCMIVKDESHCIANCLRSIRSIVSEIIVVDTGSSDGSDEIARAFGAKVFDYKWDDDFAAARNYSLSKASGDWILVLDADEVIAQQDLAAFKELTQDKAVCSQFFQRHYSNDCRISKFTACKGEFPELEKSYTGYFESPCCRLFPNHEKLEFIGRIHELIEHSIAKRSDLTVKHREIRIHHYGHTPEIKSIKNKSSLYTPLGEEKTKDTPSDWKGFFELGVEYNQNARYADAIRSFISSIELKQDYVETWINLGYAFLEIGMYKEAEDALKKAISLAPRSSEAFCNLGVVYMRQKRFDAAEIALQQAVNISPKYINAICNLGDTYAWLNRFSESAFYYRKALSISPGLARPLAELGALFLAAGKIKEAEGYLREAIARDPSHQNARLNLKQIESISSDTNPR